MSGRADVAVLGSGPVALAHALFAARRSSVVLAARPESSVPLSSVESVPAPLLTLLLELGVHPGELDVEELFRQRCVAWEGPEVVERDARAAAHVERSALLAALWRRVRGCPAIRLVDPGAPYGRARRLVDARGRGAGPPGGRRRPPRAWLATGCTVARHGLDGRLALAAGPGGYAYRLGSARSLTVGWVAPGRAPRTPGELGAAMEAAGAGWLLGGVTLAGPLWSRVASLAVPVAGRVDHTGPFALGDAALARDALASQGLSTGLSDARLAARPGWTPQAAAERTTDAIGRHTRSLGGVLATCHHRHHPVWQTYAAWVGSLPVEG